MVTVSIIIVNYRTPELIVECIKTIKQFTSKVSYEIIIVDNASKGDDEGYVKSYFPKITWLSTGYNAGFARANNAGMRIAKGKYLLLLNSDTKLYQPVIDICVENLEKRPDAIAGGANQVYPDLTPRTFYHTFTFRKDFWIVPPKFRNQLDRFFKQKQYQDPEQVDYIAAAFLMVRKEGFEKTGGLDEEFFLYGEDVEWGYRLSKLGKLLVFNDCNIIHEEWGSKPERYKEAENYTYFNRFDHQIQLSNLVWIRKQFGAFQYFLLMLHYWLWVPTFYLMKIVSNCIHLKNPFSELENQKKFAKMIGIFSNYFWNIILKKPTFYKLSK
ncbi:glycosyl transferase family 2 [Emticicia oligotrophica DSM 17448]|uniref:Glycosyl transferase family 2 n=1 Tax=Emticicia oligotrophica (strain DSM 17448 / CIP 109782 / MTCC 6937 / GPTSA100-15) TaxID=929562 RepID=A0ABN4ARD8_EMTOG|nr:MULTISPECIES: glycosyltransferase family 2 protein [Emticicia]AFK05078.1 glycosyl transferase family 2 [Emticicia oligotrophica DSM 17448]